MDTKAAIIKSSNRASRRVISKENSQFNEFKVEVDNTFIRRLDRFENRIKLCFQKLLNEINEHRNEKCISSQTTRLPIINHKVTFMNENVKVPKVSNLSNQFDSNKETSIMPKHLPVYFLDDRWQFLEETKITPVVNNEELVEAVFQTQLVILKEIDSNQNVLEVGTEKSVIQLNNVQTQSINTGNIIFKDILNLNVNLSNKRSLVSYKSYPHQHQLIGTVMETYRYVKVLIGTLVNHLKHREIFDPGGL